jgi:hypothetical protein
MVKDSWAEKQGGVVIDIPENLRKFWEDALNISYQNASVLLRKQMDYGPKNISQSPGGPLNGLRVRMFDKLARINNLIETGATPENESLRDSFLDIANYGIIALMVLDGKWEGVSND